MKIAVEGCCHGELDKIYETVMHLEQKNDIKINLLLICGDFQAVRNFDDLQAMAVPPKFQKLNSFYKYYSGEKEAPVLTIFIGGNHEASNYMQELPYGGWVAKNIYYMGYAGIIQVGGIRIGGISGIFKGHDFNKGHFEQPPYDDKSKRSVYHVRNLEVFRLKQVMRHVDIFMSHDWPEGIYHYGDMAKLIKRKPYFKEEIESNNLGSKPCAELLKHLKPTYWFAAHLHVKFAAHVEHEPLNDGDTKTTKFLALDKCLPRRQFLQVLDIPHQEEEGLKIKLDSEWLSVLQSTNHLLHLSPYNRYMPGPNGNERYDFTVTDSKMRETEELFGNDLTLPENFEQTASPVSGDLSTHRKEPTQSLRVTVNPQTTLLCTMLEITDPNAKFSGSTQQNFYGDSKIEKDESSSDPDNSDDAKDESLSFIDSSFDRSSSALNISSTLESLSDSKTNSRCDTPGSLSGADVVVRDDDEELQSILSAQRQKSISHDSSVASISSSSPDNKKLDTSMKKQSIADRLRALKNTSSCLSPSASTDSEDGSQTGSDSVSGLTKSENENSKAASAAEDTDELEEINTSQQQRQASDSLLDDSFAMSSKLSLASSSSSVNESINEKPSSGTNYGNTPDKRENNSELKQMQDQVSPNKKMKRRNVSVYQESQE